MPLTGRIVLSVLALLLSATHLRADLAFVLTPALRPGSSNEVVFTGSLSNTSGMTNLLLNDLQVVFTGTATNYLTADTNTFFANVPGVLLPGETYTDVVFGAVLNPATPPGNYFGTISLLGGGDMFATNVLAAQTFEITTFVTTLTWTNPASITYGTALNDAQLDATANVPGSFAYTPASGSVLYTGSNALSAIFTPTDGVDYRSVTDTVSLAVLPAPLTVTVSNATRFFGETNPVFQGVITGLQNGDSLTAAYICSAVSNSTVGAYFIVPELVDPADLETNYTVTLDDGTLTIVQAAAEVMWTNPAAVTYGTALSTTQLDATADVPGTFSYNPASGAVPNAGTNILSVVFTPNDAIDYIGETDVVSFVVTPAQGGTPEGEPLLPSWGVLLFLAGLAVLGVGFLERSKTPVERKGS